MVPVPAPPSTSALPLLLPPSIPASNPAPAPNPDIDSNGYQDALDRLQPLQPVLRGFNHRNRNQHRRAAWWAPFGMLRRHVERVVDELLEAADAVAAAAAAAAKSKSKKRRRDDGGGGGGVERKVRGHVEWLRDILVPKCYLYVILHCRQGWCPPSDTSQDQNPLTNPQGLLATNSGQPIRNARRSAAQRVSPGQRRLRASSRRGSASKP